MECKNNDVNAHGCRTSSGSIPFRHNLMKVEESILISVLKIISLQGNSINMYKQQAVTHTSSI